MAISVVRNQQKAATVGTTGAVLSGVASLRAVELYTSETAGTIYVLRAPGLVDGGTAHADAAPIPVAALPLAILVQPGQVVKLWADADRDIVVTPR